MGSIIIELLNQLCLGSGILIYLCIDKSPFALVITSTFSIKYFSKTFLHWESLDVLPILKPVSGSFTALLNKELIFSTSNRQIRLNKEDRYPSSLFANQK